jgi:Uma2 family endonuclease
MNAVVATRKYTPEDLLRMPDGNRYELIDGELVEKVMSTKASYVAGNIHVRIHNYANAHQQGWAFPEGNTYQCFRDAPDKVRKADTSFIRKERLSLAQYNQDGHCPIAPDLSVEVVSPNDVKYEVDRKVNEFINAGTQLVWVINPDVRTVEVHRADGSGVILNENNTLSGENVLPGFSCKVSDLFVTPQ